MTHNTNSTIVRTNGTLLNGWNNFTASASHVGQIFFDQALISQAEKTTPYSTNTQELTLNSDDDILAQELADIDPMAEYAMLGDTIEDGIMAWISIGVDPTADDDVTSAGTHYKFGGVANENSDIGGPPGGGNATGPSGTMRSGAPPSGAPPSK
jgi:hypothetical protein